MKLIQRIFLVKLLLHTAVFISSAQVNLGLLKDIDAAHFQLKNPKDTIDFVLIDGKTDVVKPVLIFCQGSNPIPLITILPSGKKFMTTLSFDYKKLAKDYHLIMISPPGVPVEVQQTKLNKAYCVITDTANQVSYPSNYLKNNYAENYIRRTKEVITYLSQQKWVNNKKIILFGHSQGARIVIGAGLNNLKVSKIGYASGNPLGRMDQLIREQKELALQGKITPAEAQDEIENMYDMWRKINERPNATSTEFGDPNKTWTSFSAPYFEEILKIKQPLYVVYGTEDITARFCDLLPVYFIKEHKSNLTLKPLVGQEHNFFEVDKDGKPIYTKDHWPEVMDDFIKWVEK